MTTPRRIVALVAALATSVVSVAAVAPAARADSTYQGDLDGTEPPLGAYPPDVDNDRCGTSGPTITEPAEVVSFVSQSDGPRRFAVRRTDGAPSIFLLFVYRNGVCVAADIGPDDGDAVDAATSVTDVENVSFRKGDRVVVRITGTGRRAWTLAITQPGTANAAAAGKGSSYVKLPYQVSCSSHQATVKATGKARKVKSVVFKAGGKKVGSVQRVRAGQKIKLKKIPSRASSIKAVVKLKGGGKAKVVRAYSACR
ncbi:hypothetical protein ABFU82_09350 [Nocardioides sp. WV_118_6]|uniref:hypothetical protein n=1 Tax=Nocardioides simplex TaxID=2045 RepID=UPI0021500D97|nr:hypothetical protein [Pimelobacter simplex]UUW88946.1 hypothetical protein M0M43_24875 [Pimelobacter simplex]UUW98451.1 hypothetical protein M0M48_13525 [Pimelobacter simplex]